MDDEEDLNEFKRSNSFITEERKVPLLPDIFNIKTDYFTNTSNSLPFKRNVIDEIENDSSSNDENIIK